jgi:hypothetical protein
MDDNPAGADGCGPVQMDYEPMGLLWLPVAAHAWRLRGTEALDGDHQASASDPVVLL